MTATHELLAAAMKRNNLSVGDVAQALGFRESTVNMMIDGRAKIPLDRFIPLSELMLDDIGELATSVVEQFYDAKTLESLDLLLNARRLYLSNNATPE